MLPDRHKTTRKEKEMQKRLRVVPVRKEQWSDLEKLFGPRGACGGCWCMYWRQTRSEYELLKGEGNKQFLKSLVEDGVEPGLLAYDGDTPAGWIALAPRSEYSTLARSRVLKPVDDQPVWSITCFFVSRSHRRKGLTGQLVSAAIEYARSRGASILEAYPVDPRGDKKPDVFVYTGLLSTFEKAGFREVERRSETRPIVRLYL